jgi:drug/metabolite transporter (DMT)-like permease
MRVRAVIGVIFCIAGVVWILQGSNVIHGSSMSGEHLWLYIGIVVLVIGAVLLGAARRLGGHRTS